MFSIPTAPAKRTRQRGQILVLMAVFMGVILLLATVLIDGAFMFQAQRDLEVVAQHAARRGASEIDWTYYRTHCPAASNGAQACPSALRLTGNARSTAEDHATQWIAQSSAQRLQIPGRAPRGMRPVTTRLSNANRTLTVELVRCYDPFILDLFADRGGACPGMALIRASSSAQPQGGN